MKCVRLCVCVCGKKTPEKEFVRKGVHLYSFFNSFNHGRLMLKGFFMMIFEEGRKLKTKDL